jgi:methionine synthase II (cobalamin-independent)
MLFPMTLMKYLPQDVAFGKMRAMVEAARMLRREYTGSA